MTFIIHFKDGHISRPYVDWNRVSTLLKIKGVL